MYDLSSFKTGPMSFIQARHGLFLIIDGDSHCPAGSLEHYGEFCEHEIELLTELVNERSFVIEVGSNIGTHVIPIARRLILHGRYIAYEPQPIIAALLEANLALNGLRNIDVRVKAAGSTLGHCKIPIIDYTNVGNSGAISLQYDFLNQSRSLNNTTEALGGFAPVERLDDIERFSPVTLIKIDAEGMEYEVLKGARAIIESDKPLVYFEEHSLAVPGQTPETPSMRFLKDRNYVLYGHVGSLHRTDNFNNQQQPLFLDFGGSHNILAVHNSNTTIDKSLIDRFELSKIQ